MPSEIMRFFKSHELHDVNSKILSLCADVLGGEWVNLHLDHITISRVRGGLTNLVYLVSRPTFSSSDEEQSTVLLRIQSETDREKLLRELVVFTSLAENGLGPKLLGIFPGGRFEEYIPSKHVNHRDVANSRICILLARLLPRFHSAVVPISKRPSLLSMMREWLSFFEGRGDSQVRMHTTSFQLHQDAFPDVVTTNDLIGEIDCIEEFLGTSSSPVVFCHNDLTSGNLLISTAELSTPSSAPEIVMNGKDKEGMSLHLVDFEFSSYNYRGFDLANYFCASAIEHNLPDYPRYKIDLSKLQNRSIKLEFCKEYVREAKKLNIQIKSEFSLLREIDQFTPVVHLFWSIFNLYCEKDTLAIMDCGAYARDRLALYYYTRSNLYDR